MYSYIPRLTQRIHEAFAASSAGMKAAHGTRPVCAEPIHGSGATPTVPTPIKRFEEHQSGAGRMAKTGGTGPSYRASYTQTPIGPHVVPDELERLVGEEIDRMLIDNSSQRFSRATQTPEQTVSTHATVFQKDQQGFWQGRLEDFQQLHEGTLNIFATAPGGAADVLATGVVGAAQLYESGTNLGLIGIVSHLQRFDELNEAQLRRLDTNIRILGFFGRDEEAHLARSTFARLWDGTLSPADVPVGELLAGTEDYTFLLDLMQQANDFRAGVHAAFPPRPGFEDHLTTDIGRGLGAVSVYLATMALPGSQARFVAGNALGILGSQGSMVERAIADGATRDQVAVAAAMATIPGLTEMLPLEYLIRMPALRNGLLRSLAEAGRQGLLEGGQEALQTVMHNAIVQMVYDEDQDLLEGAVVSSEAGAGVGLTLGMMQQFAGGLIGARIREPRTVMLGGEQVTIEPRTGGQTDPNQRLGDDLALDQGSEVLDGSGEWWGRRTIDRNSGRPIFDQLNVPEIGSRACGPTSCAMILADNGVSIDIEELARRSSLDELGTQVPGLARALRNAGLSSARHDLDASFDDVVEATRHGNPAIVLIKNSLNPTELGHFVVVDGIATRHGQRMVAIRDPWRGRQFFVETGFFSELMQGNVVFTDTTR